MKIKQAILSILRQVLPDQLYWRLLAWWAGQIEPEMNLLPRLCDRSKISMDVGASGGAYSCRLLVLSKFCCAFEPRPEAANNLVNKLSGRASSSLKVEAVGLSDRSGEARFRMPLNDLGKSTMETSNPLNKEDHIETITASKDPVGFIKIDVEGHEESVLRGATNILRRDHPSLVIEIEERHNSGSVPRVNSFLQEFGYQGYFYRSNHLIPIDCLNIRKDQDPRHLRGNKSDRLKYINNFVFLHQNKLEEMDDVIVASRDELT
jgi:FkbM family methyltransferase